MGIIFRKVVGPLFAAFVLAIIAGMALEFFDALEGEKAWSENTFQRWDAFVAALRQFVTHTWFLCAASGLGGLTLGLWLDRIFRERQLIETVQSTDAETAPSPNAIANASAQPSRRELAKRLDDLYAEGVQLRNKVRNVLRSPKSGDILDARDRFRGWHKKVLLALDNDLISNRRRSRLRTLDLFNPSIVGGSSKLEQQKALWNENLDRLRQIIDIDLVSATGTTEAAPHSVLPQPATERRASRAAPGGSRPSPS
jgi:hypothetical protein